jgi:hypothetical protein
MIDDDVRLERPDRIPFLIEQGAHERAHMLEQLEPGAKALPAGDGGLALRRIKEGQEFFGEGREGHAMRARHVLELNWRGKLNRMALVHEA